MKIGEILKVQQPDIHNKLQQNSRLKQKRRKDSQESLYFSDIKELMKHDSYYRGKGGSIKQK